MAVRQRETAELLHVELAMRVVADDAVDDGHDAQALDAAAQLTDRLLPGRHLASPPVVQAHGPPHLLPDRRWLVVHTSVAHELHRVDLALDSLLAQPVLPALHCVDRVEEIGTRSSRSMLHDPKVRDRQGLLGWLGKKQVAKRRVGRLGERLELLEGRLPLAALPGR